MSPDRTPTLPIILRDVATWRGHLAWPLGVVTWRGHLCTQRGHLTCSKYLIISHHPLTKTFVWKTGGMRGGCLNASGIGPTPTFIQFLVSRLHQRPTAELTSFASNFTCICTAPRCFDQAYQDCIRTPTSQQANILKLKTAARKKFHQSLVHQLHLRPTAETTSVIIVVIVVVVAVVVVVVVVIVVVVVVQLTSLSTDDFIQSPTHIFALR